MSERSRKNNFQRVRDEKTAGPNHVLFGLLIVAATLLAYQPMWQAGFIWDDDRFVWGNSLITQSDGLYRLWFTTAAPDYWPLTSTTLWLEWRLWGSAPLGYHLVNVFLHAASAVVWWRVLARLKIPGAWLAAAIFALHPVNVESVAWITERKNTLAMLFFALTLLGYVRFEESNQRKWYWMSIGAFVLALLSKTAVAPLPVVLLGLAWWQRGRIERRDLYRSLPFLAAAMFLAGVTIWFQSHRNIGAEVVRTDGFGSRFAGAGCAAWFYLSKILFPVNLMFVYPRWHIDGTKLLSFVPAMLLLAAFVGCWLGRGRWGRGPLVGLGYFVVMLLPVLGFVDIYFMRYSLVADHWQYFAIPGPIVLGAAAIARALHNRKQIAPLVYAGLLVVLGVATWRQSGLYVSSEKLWQDNLAKNPNTWLAQHDLAKDLVLRNKFNEAIPHYYEALRIEPGYLEAYNNLGYALLRAGQVDEAIRIYRQGVQLDPRNVEALNSLGVILATHGNLAEAAECFRSAVRANPADAKSHSNLGNALKMQDKMEDAIAEYREAVRLAPGESVVQKNLGQALATSGHREEAIIHLREALRLNPNDADASELLKSVEMPR